MVAGERGDADGSVETAAMYTYGVAAPLVKSSLWLKSEPEEVRGLLLPPVSPLETTWIGRAVPLHCLEQTELWICNRVCRG